MGVIKKILHRSQILGNPRHRNLFLDMEENIHIHYRDLRIELSRFEFEEFSRIFNKQSEELQSIIVKKDYHDGKFANANQDDVRIFTESRLHHEVIYHPKRFSLEECGDGYHFHYRNYKFLIDEADFRKLAEIFRNLDLDAPFARTYKEVNELLHANDIDFMPDNGNIEDQVLAIAVAKHHMPKVRDIFKYINFNSEAQGDDRIYTTEGLKVITRPDTRFNALDYKRMRGVSHTGRLVDFLASNGAVLDKNRVNLIKCQVLDLYYALLAGKVLYVDLNPHMWLFSSDNGHVIFPYSSAAQEGKAKAESLYRTWANLLARLQLNFIKPGKLAFPPESQKQLLKQVEGVLTHEVAAFACVQRIYTMGSLNRSDMGRYHAPFVHGKLAKLGSDVDILVELHPDREADVPSHWTLNVPEASNHCAVYHITQIPMQEEFEDWTKKHPNIKFIEHLIDAYVYFPSHGHTEEKNEFLKKFGAKIFYDRDRDGAINFPAENETISAHIKSQYGFQNVVVEKMNVSTENKIYKVFTEESSYILKLFKIGGNYSRSRVAEHVKYEQTLIAELRERGVDTPAVLPNINGSETTIEGFPYLLFDRIAGVVNQRPEYPIESVTKALAFIHKVQLEKSFDIHHKFEFDDVCMMWLPCFSQYISRPELNKELQNCFLRLTPMVDYFNPGDHRSVLYKTSPFIHLHGDVTPKNVMSNDSGSSVFFDFNNSFYGPRIYDVIDGAIEFSLAEKYIHLADFARFSKFFDCYEKFGALTDDEKKNKLKWIQLVGVIKFIKEIRVFLERPAESLRQKRALAIANFLTLLEKDQ